MTIVLCGAQGKSDAEIEKFKKFFIEAQKVVDAKQLRPMIRTQYMRTAFQIPFDSTVRISLDTNLCMIKENPADGPTCHVAGRCEAVATSQVWTARLQAFVLMPVHALVHVLVLAAVLVWLS